MEYCNSVPSIYLETHERSCLSPNEKNSKTVLFVKTGTSESE